MGLWSDEATSTAADDDQIRVETCTDPCGLNRSDEAASTAADDDQTRVETCTDPCGLNWIDEAASTAADDDQNRHPLPNIFHCTAFKQHVLLDENQKKSEFSKMFMFLPSTLDRKEKFLQWQDHVHLHPVDVSYDELK